MTVKQRVLDLLSDNPKITNAEISESVDISLKYVAKTISILKSEGYINVEYQDSVRTVEVIRGLSTGKNDFKKTVYQRLIDTYLLDFEESETRNDRIEVGNLILRILKEL